MAKIGILGGTFDPVHTGHVECAKMVRDEFGLDRVLLLPAGNPPHKFATPVTPALTRLKLVEIAAEGLDGISVCDIEVRKNGYTFAADTLAELKETYPGDELYYITGTDCAAGIENWKDAAKLKDFCRFILINRKGLDEDVAGRALEALKNIGGRVDVSECVAPDISSTSIREAFSEGKMPEGGVVPEKVAEFIMANGLYRKWPVSEDAIIDDLRSVLPQKRFIHSLGVAEEAVRLAEKFGADVNKARLAGLLHDCAKGVSIAQLRFIGMSEDDFSLGPNSGFSYRVLHGPLGAVVAKSRYGVVDQEVLSAVAKHTTGDREMSLLDRIVFIADYTEKNRCGGFFEEVRNLVDSEGLVAAIAFACDETIKIILKRGEPIDIRTIYTRNMALREKEAGKQ